MGSCSRLVDLTKVYLFKSSAAVGSINIDESKYNQ